MTVSHQSHREPLTEAEYFSAVALICVLVIIGGIVAGLTIGLMSIDNTNLAILKSSGTPSQKKYATRIEPIRKNGHLLLVTLLLVNTLVNETLPILFDYIHLSGLKAVLFSVVLILIFGEIIPQAVCNRYGLEIGAFFAWPVRILMFVMYFVSAPIASLLDYILGHDHGMIYRHAELKELVALHGEDQAGPLTKDEVSIVNAVLDLRHKTVANIMTKLSDTFMLSISAQLDRNTLRSILAAGHSRVPIYSNQRDKIVGVVLVKQLILNDPDDKVHVSSIKFRRLPRVRFDTPLFEMLHIFEGGGSHMAAVVEPVSSSPSLNISNEELWSKDNGGNLDYKTVGIVTLEDVIEELLGEEVSVQPVNFDQQIDTQSQDVDEIDDEPDEVDENMPLMKKPKKADPNVITLPVSMIYQKRTNKNAKRKKKKQTMLPADELLLTPDPVYISRTSSPYVNPSVQVQIEPPALSLEENASNIE